MRLIMPLFFIDYAIVSLPGAPGQQREEVARVAAASQQQRVQPERRGRRLQGRVRRQRHLHVNPRRAAEGESTGVGRPSDVDNNI